MSRRSLSTVNAYFRLFAASQLSSSNDGSCSKRTMAASLYAWLVDFGSRRPTYFCSTSAASRDELALSTEAV